MAAPKKIYVQAEYVNDEYYTSESEFIEDNDLESGNKVLVYELKETLVYNSSLVPETKKK
jgi:hypothetical protein